MADANRIESAKTDKIQSVVERINVPYKGFIDSGKLDQFMEAVTEDVTNIVTQTNGLATAVHQSGHIQALDKVDAHQRALALEEQLAFMRRMASKRGERVALWKDFHDATGISYPEGSDPSLRAAVASEYGQVTLPMNSIESRTYALRLLAGGTVTPSSVLVNATGTFDKLEGDGVTDYEYSGTVEETDPRNCVNGNNTEYWRRRVIFDLDSDVSEVESEITIQVPASANLYANVIYAHAYPLGNVDIVGVWASTDLSDSFLPISSFETVEGAGKERWFIPSQKIAKLKLRIRQRNWFEENGKKVFEYGFQEVGIQLVDWDKRYDATATALTSNHRVVIRLDADDGFEFRRLFGFYTKPDFTLEPVENRHLHFQLARDEAGVDVVWDSDSSAPPQNLAAAIDLGDVETLYLIMTINWCESVDSGSPFVAGTPPFINGFGLDCTYVEIS
ncbi:MAG: hypothetical protein E6R03_08120 [Hyphomicrobiaceae bacterium]|nr:MAG: hypothetical protein E6R03_08120 [Hyphomicrobiaceae bacterium]